MVAARLPPDDAEGYPRRKEVEMEYRTIVALKDPPHKARTLTRSNDPDTLINHARTIGHKYFNVEIVDETDEAVWSLHGVFRFVNAPDVLSES